MTKLERLLRRDGLFIGAHRGYSERYPENTLLAVQEGIALGVDLVEVDLMVVVLVEDLVEDLLVVEAHQSLLNIGLD